MEYAAELSALGVEYAQAVQELQKNRKRFDGIFGFGNPPGNAPCHDQMDQRAEALCRRAAEEGTPAEAAGLTESLFRMEESCKGPEYARLSLVAAQRHTIPLIPRMTKEDRERLRAWYEKRYPRRMRLPVQERILKLLKE